MCSGSIEAHKTRTKTKQRDKTYAHRTRWLRQSISHTKHLVSRIPIKWEKWRKTISRRKLN